MAIINSEGKLAVSKKPKWRRRLSRTAWVNSVAITDNGRRVVAGTFIHQYKKNGKRVLSAAPNRRGTFGIFAYDSSGNQLWRDTYVGWDGVFAVGISGTGQIAAAGGWHDKKRGLLRIYDAANGKIKFDFLDKELKRVSLLSLSQDGGVVAAAANKLYVFVRQGGSYVRLDHPDFSGAFQGKVTAVAVHPSGSWFVASDKKGNVLLATISDGKVKHTCQWSAPKAPINPKKPSTDRVLVPFLSIQVARHAESFAVSGGDFVYLFTKSGICRKKPSRVYDTRNERAPGQQTPKGNSRTHTAAENVRWLAISDDGSFLTTVANRSTGKAKTGLLLAYKRRSSAPVWKVALPHNPNGTSLDGEAKCVALADGYCTNPWVKPPDPPGKECDSAFYLFSANGEKLWEYPTSNMNWPIFISANGSAVAAGGDNGNLYYFKP
jgi:WD40 repeat protein